jgi:exodeoxyribonuclease V beta subunit
MYVALTRAAARLHLFHLPAAVFGVTGAYAPVNDRLPALAGDADVEWRRTGEPDGERAAASRPLAIAAPPPALDEPALPEEIERLRGERAGPVLTSYTRIKRESPELAGRAGRDQPGAGGGIGGLDGREVGLLLHWILERAPLTAAGAGEPEAVATDPDLERLLGAGMDAFGLELAHRDEIAALVAKALTAELSVGQQPLGNLSAADGAAREVEFTYPVDRDGALRGYVSGYIDVLFEKAGKLYVLDWKSDALLDYGAAALAEHTRASYQVQSELYSLALARMVGLDLSPDGDDSGYERFGGLIYCYLRAPVSIGERPTPGELRRRAAALATSEVTWQR